MEVIKTEILTHNILQIKKISKKIAQNLEMIDDKKIHLLFSRKKENFYEKNTLEDLKRDINLIKQLLEKIEHYEEVNLNFKKNIEDKIREEVDSSLINSSNINIELLCINVKNQL